MNARSALEGDCGRVLATGRTVGRCSSTAQLSSSAQRAPRTHRATVYYTYGGDAPSPPPSLWDAAASGDNGSTNGHNADLAQQWGCPQS
ncbi:hypothetical protein MRX96_016880 [Rhipicephalus microplus]